MPTGYTSGILDGTIKTFPEFAKLCMRAFGATIHMRDDALGAEYVPRVPSNYDTEQIERSKGLLMEYSKLSDESIIVLKKEELKTDRDYHQKRIKEIQESRKRLDEFVTQIESWVPPASDHIKFKNFMIEQINSTIEWDCNPKYHEEQLATIEKEYRHLDPKSIREEWIEKEEKNLSYYTEQHEKEVERCKQANKWVEDLLKSL